VRRCSAVQRCNGDIGDRGAGSNGIVFLLASLLLLGSLFSSSVVAAVEGENPKGARVSRVAAARALVGCWLGLSAAKARGTAGMIGFHATDAWRGSNPSRLGFPRHGRGRGHAWQSWVRSAGRGATVGRLCRGAAWVRWGGEARAASRACG
jgi:hypothetical protein